MDFSQSSAFTNLLGSARAPFSFSSKALTKAQRTHIKQIFATLSGGIIATAAGAYVSYRYFHIPQFLCIIGEMAAMFYIANSSDPSSDSKIRNPKRLAAFGIAAYLMGCGMMPLLAFASFLNPAVIVQAIFISIAIFLSFFGAAVFTKNRSVMYLGAVLGAATSYMLIISLVQIIFRTQFMHSIILYGGLFMSAGYVYYFTQQTINEFDSGNRDFVLHGLHFYVNLISIFVRILIILTQNEAKAQSRGDRENKRRRD